MATTKETLEQIGMTVIPSAVIKLGGMLAESATQDPSTRMLIDAGSDLVATGLPIYLAERFVQTPWIKYGVQAIAGAFGGYALLDDLGHFMPVLNAQQEYNKYRTVQWLGEKKVAVEAFLGSATAGLSWFKKHWK